MNKSLALVIVLIATINNMAFAKLKCTEGTVYKNDQALSTEELAKVKAKVEKKLAKVSEVKENAKDPEKRAEKKTKLTAKLELINSCGN